MNLKEMGFELHVLRDNRREHGQGKEWAPVTASHEAGHDYNTTIEACQAVETSEMSLCLCSLGSTTEV